MSIEIDMAKEITGKFMPLVTTWDCYWDTELPDDAIIKDAKKCAVICVQYIIDELPDTICGYMPEGGTAMEIDNFRKYFWKEVKEEIEKL